MGSLKDIAADIRSGFWRHIGGWLAAALLAAIAWVAVNVWEPLRITVLNFSPSETIAWPLSMILLVFGILCFAVAWIVHWVRRQKINVILSRLRSGDFTVEDIETMSKLGAVGPEPRRFKPLTDKPPGIVPIDKPKMTDKPPGVIPFGKPKRTNKPPGRTDL